MLPSVVCSPLSSIVCTSPIRRGLFSDILAWCRLLRLVSSSTARSYSLGPGRCGHCSHLPLFYSPHPTLRKTTQQLGQHRESYPIASSGGLAIMLMGYTSGTGRC